ncbi:hypothetical protein [Clostridium sp.]|uniref:hypothetical protein n=1 Tax=Clostridium sp. TaxID=1506 RepID=UPI001B671938|nr:hypothetical protein [Clostridium sp.]MBP3916203.1 hypothetical protein [Clostridium sp.]
MSWNYRVVKRNCNGEYCFKIEEVYYDEYGNINGYGEASAPCGEDVEEIRTFLELMANALKKEFIDLT